MSNQESPIAVMVPRPGSAHFTAFALIQDRVLSALCDALPEAAPLVPEQDGRVLAGVAASAALSSVMQALVAAFAGGDEESVPKAQEMACDFIQNYAAALRHVEPRQPH